MKLIWKPPGTERLKLKCDDPLTIFAFKFNLRRYNTVLAFARVAEGGRSVAVVGRRRLTLPHPS
jgi:hypothetical protein